MEQPVAAPALLRLLAAAAEDRSDVDLSSIPLASAQRALDCGLGPLLFRVTKNHPRSTASPLHPLLHGADITSRVLVQEQLDGLQEILQALGDSARHVTLLKGISICQTHYPAPHLRVMGDMDLLIVDDRLRAAAETRLRELGYRQQSHYPPEFYQTLHHSMPFFHPRRKIWVEVHRQLFPTSAAVSHDKVFALTHLVDQAVPAEFRGLSCRQLSQEMQLVYTCSHWAREINTVRGLVPIVDTIYLLNRGQQPIDWNLILSWLPGSAAAADLCLMMTYLHHRGLAEIPRDVIDRLAAYATNLNRLNRSLLWRLIDRSLVEGYYGRILSEANVGIIWKTLLSQGSPTTNLLAIPWHLALPPDNPRRFSPGFHLNRIASALGLRR